MFHLLIYVSFDKFYLSHFRILLVWEVSGLELPFKVFQRMWLMCYFRIDQWDEQEGEQEDHLLFGCYIFIFHFSAISGGLMILKKETWDHSKHNKASLGQSVLCSADLPRAEVWASSGWEDVLIITLRRPPTLSLGCWKAGWTSSVAHSAFLFFFLLSSFLPLHLPPAF